MTMHHFPSEVVDRVVHSQAYLATSLVVAEVELQDPEQPVPIPACCVLELTGLPSLSNAALAHHPLAHWPEYQRQQLLSGSLDWADA